MDETGAPTLLSILTPSRRLHQLEGLLENLEVMTGDPTSVEVVVKVDDDMEEAVPLLEGEMKKRPYRIKYIASPRLGGHFTQWAAAYEMFRMADPRSYFLMFVSDEIRFETKNWDDVMRRYVGFYPDHAFRLRVSLCKYRNYVSNFSCAIMPESIAIFTRTWLEVTNGTGDCWGTDAYQECIAFHLGLGSRSYNTVMHEDGLWRDVQIHDLEFGGMDFGHDVRSDTQLAQNIRMHREWRRLSSYSVQREFTYRARRLFLYVWARERGIKSFYMRRRDWNHTVALYDAGCGHEVRRLSFRPPRMPIFVGNLKRDLLLAPKMIGRFVHQFRILYLGYDPSRAKRKRRATGYLRKVEELRIRSLDWVERKFGAGESAAKTVATGLVTFLFMIMRLAPDLHRILWRATKQTVSIISRQPLYVVDWLLAPLDRLMTAPPPGTENTRNVIPASLMARFKRTGYILPDREAVYSAYGELKSMERELDTAIFTCDDKRERDWKRHAKGKSGISCPTDQR